MKLRILFLALLALTPTHIWQSHADYGVMDRGGWPDTWPESLEKMRPHARTLEGGLINILIHEIPFKDRDTFEALWPDILSVKSPGAPIILVSSPYTRLGNIKAGVRIQCPPDTGRKSTAQPRDLQDGTSRSHRVWTTHIYLVVDGDVVDLNRIHLPENTPIVDQRFESDTPKPRPRPKATNSTKIPPAATGQ